MQDWIARHAQAAAKQAAIETDPTLRRNLEEMAGINRRLVSEPPRTFREACQWACWFQMAARMYNGSGALGRLDLLLFPFYERDVVAGVLDDEEAIFHIACLLLRDTAYIQLGGPDEQGGDATNRVSYLALEAAHRLNVPANIGVCVGDQVDPGLLRRGIEIIFADRNATPKFLGIDNTTAGFARNGYPLELARTRAYSGCHWSAIPGREYTMNDMPKVNFAAVFDVAFREMLADPSSEPSIGALWSRFERHLQRAIRVLAEGFDFHIEHMHRVFPELVLDLLCYGPIERGLDASHGGVEYYNLCVDGAALATAADSFAAAEQRVESEQRMTWSELLGHLDANWTYSDGERARLMMRHVRAGSRVAADFWAEHITAASPLRVTQEPRPPGIAWCRPLLVGAHPGDGTRVGRDAQWPPRRRSHLSRAEPRSRLPQRRRADGVGGGRGGRTARLRQRRAHAARHRSGHRARGWRSG
jgi:formate C-acetyltransferase